jgi:hypothetical protein
MMPDSQMNEIRYVFHGLETLYQTYFPKVDPVLLHGLLVREEEKSERAPFYMVEVFTKPGTDSEWCKDHIWKTTGFVPAIYDKGTHYLKECIHQIGKLDRSAIEEMVTGYYVDGKISESHRQLIKDKISQYYENMLLIPDRLIQNR